MGTRKKSIDLVWHVAREVSEKGRVLMRFRKQMHRTITD